MAGIIFAAASFTDFLDGHLARKWHMVTDFGKFADPLADKLLTTVAFIYMLRDGVCSPVVLCIILAREFAVSGLRMVAVQPKAPVLFTALSMAFVLLLPLFAHCALPRYAGPARCRVRVYAAGARRRVRFQPAGPARLVSLAAFTGMLMLTRRSYMFTVVAFFFLLYGVWVLARAARARQVQTALRFGRFAAASLVCVGVPLLPMFWRASPRPTTVTATRPTRPAAFWQSWPTSVSIWAGSCLRLCADRHTIRAV